MASEKDPLGLFDGSSDEKDPLGLFEKEDRNYAERVIHEGAPAVGSMGLDIVRSIPSGIRGLSSVIGDLAAKPFSGESIDSILQRGAERVHSNMESLGSGQMEDEGANQAKEALSGGIDQLQQLAGGGVEQMRQLQSKLAGVEDILGPETEAGMKAEAAARTFGEAGSNFLPIPGAELAAKGLRKVIPALDTHAAKIRQLEQIQKMLDEDKAKKMQTAQTPELDFGPDELQMRSERSPYHMPEADRIAMERELNNPTQIRYPDELAKVDGQGDMFLDPQTTGGYGGRNKVGTDLEAKQMTIPGLDSEANTARAAMDLARTERGQPPIDQLSGRGYAEQGRPELGPMNWDPSVGEQMAARAKPGFMRDAIDVMRSRELGDVGPGKKQRGGPGAPDDPAYRKFIDISTSRTLDNRHLGHTSVVKKNGLWYAEVYGPPAGKRPNYMINHAEDGIWEVKWDDGHQNEFGDEASARKFAEAGGHYPEPGAYPKTSDVGPFESQAEAREHGEMEVMRQYQERLVDKGPGRSQRGGNVPSSKKSSEYEQFKKEAEARGIVLPDSVVRSVFDGTKPDLAPVFSSGHPQEHIKHVLDQNPGLKSIRESYVDDRTPEQIKKALDDPKIKDMNPLNKHIIGKIINGRFVATDHPLLSWTSSRIHAIKNWANLEAGKRLHGASPKKPDPGTYNYYWKQLKTRERQDVNEVGQSFNNDLRYIDDRMIQERAQQLLGHELTEAQLNSYKDRVRINKVVLADLNAYLKSQGRDPIAELSNYWSPAEYDGAYLTFFKHKGTGETIKVSGTYMEPNVKKLAKQFPEYDISFIERRRQPSVDLETFEVLMRQLSKEQRDPAAQAIAEALRRSGIRKHGMKRRQFEGAAGTGDGSLFDPAKPLHDYERVSEEYIRNIYEYLGHRKLDKLFNEIADITPPEGPHKNARAYAMEATDVARGGSNEAMRAISDLVSNIFTGSIRGATGNMVRLPRRFTDDFIKLGNRAKTTLLLGFFNMPYMTAQLFQHSFMIPAMRMHMLKSGMDNRSTALAIFRALGETYNDLVKGATGTYIKDRAELEAIGAIEATFKYDYGNYASGDVIRDAKATALDHVTGISANQLLEKHAVRKPAGLFTVKMLRELGYDKIAKDDKEIYKVAKELVDKYMVTNRYYEKAHVFSRSSSIGAALSPLQNWSTTWAGMLKEYMQFAGQGIKKGELGKTLPLAEFMAINLVLGGVMGLVGVKEWDTLSHYLNEWFGYNLPSATEFVLGNVKNKEVRYGLVGQLVGQAMGFENGLNLGSTFSAPSITTSVAPGVQFWFNMGDAAYVGTKAMFDKATEVEKREAAKGLAPRSGTVPWWNWADIERRHTPNGVPYERNTGGSAQYRRSDDDWRARRFGTYTIPEAEYKAQTYVANRDSQERSARFSDTKTEIVDRLLNDNRDNSELIEKLVNDGYTHDEVLKGIREGLKARLVEPQDKMQGHVKSSRQARIYQLLRELK